MHDDNERLPAGIVATYSRYIQAPEDLKTPEMVVFCERVGMHSMYFMLTSSMH
jgi:hypothetical protein